MAPRVVVRQLTTDISSCDVFTTAGTQRPLENDIMIASLCELKRIAWMHPPVLCVSRSHGTGAHDTMLIHPSVPHWGEPSLL